MLTFRWYGITMSLRFSYAEYLMECHSRNPDPIERVDRG